MLIGSPRQPVVPHLGGGQRTCVLHGGQQTKSRWLLGTRDPASWSAYPAHHRVDRITSGPQYLRRGQIVEERVLPGLTRHPRRGRAGPAAPARRAHSAASPRGSPHRPSYPSSSASVSSRSWQRPTGPPAGAAAGRRAAVDAHSQRGLSARSRVATAPARSATAVVGPAGVPASSRSRSHPEPSSPGATATSTTAFCA